jgi:hypothetical protein
MIVSGSADCNNVNIKGQLTVENDVSGFSWVAAVILALAVNTMSVSDAGSNWALAETDLDLTADGCLQTAASLTEHCYSVSSSI